MNWHATVAVLAITAGVGACWTAPGIAFGDNLRAWSIATVVLVIVAALGAGFAFR